MKPQGKGVSPPEMPIDLDTDAKQEAARFLTGSMDARPMIRGIEDEQRLADWEAVADQLDLESRQERAIRQRREAMTGDDVEVSEAFTPASEMETAVADGGAVVEEDDDVDDELDEDQEWMEYEDAAERQSKKRDAASVAKYIETADEVREKISEEYDRDVVRPHVFDALEERLEVLDA